MAFRPLTAARAGVRRGVRKLGSRFRARWLKSLVNPDLSWKERRLLERDNGYVVTTTQALFGLIDRSVEAVGLQILEGELVLWFWTHGDPADLEDDLEEVVFSLAAFLWPEDLYITTKAICGSPTAHVFSCVRMIYRAKRAH